MASILKEFGPRGVRVIALSLEPKDSAATVADWMKEYGGDSLETGAADPGAAAKLHRLGSVEFGPIPSTVFVSARGKVTRVMNSRDHAELAAAVREIVPH